MTFSWRRFGVAAVFGVLLSYLVVVNGIASIAGTTNPLLVLKFAPYDATANAAQADRLQQFGASDHAQADAARYSRNAIERSLLIPVAVRILGFEAEQKRDLARARALLLESAKLSRRDLGTSLWLINDAVQKGDTTTALQYYDTAMRSSAVARTILFPILTDAIADPEFIEPMIKLLVSRPNWSGEFVVFALASGKATPNLASIVAKSPGIIRENPPIAQALLDVLIRENRFEEAWDLNAALTSNTRRGAVADTRFVANNALVPFGWRFSGHSDFGVVQSERGLDLFALAETGGVAASQLLLLRPGRYRLQSIGRIRTGGASWTATCSGNVTQELAILPVSLNGVSVSSEFTVPAGCAATWLRLVLRTDGAPEGLSGHVREVQVQRLTR